MDDNVDALQRPQEPALIADIADEKAQREVFEPWTPISCCLSSSRLKTMSFWVVFPEHDLDKLLAEGTGSTGD